MPALTRPQTVAEYIATGFQGLRIPKCPDCHISTWRSWSDLDAGAEDDVFEVAKRLRCELCGLPPAGIAVVASTGQSAASG